MPEYFVLSECLGTTSIIKIKYNNTWRNQFWKDNIKTVIPLLWLLISFAKQFTKPLIDIKTGIQHMYLNKNYKNRLQNLLSIYNFQLCLSNWSWLSTTVPWENKNITHANTGPRINHTEGLTVGFLCHNAPHRITKSRWPLILPNG